MTDTKIKMVIVIPFYNHESLIDKMLKSLQTAQLNCLLINDGSRPEAREVLQILAEKYHWLTIVHRDKNGGKGAAVITGFQEAQKAGYTHALQIDADCQHDVTDIAKFTKLSTENPNTLILGHATYDESVPRPRYYGRYINHYLVMLETLSPRIIDTMCGFRVYPLAEVLPVIENGIGQKMDFDIEVVVKMIWRRTNFITLPTRVQYPEDGVSHFHYLKGNIGITLMHIRLCLGMLCRLPLLLKRKCCK